MLRSVDRWALQRLKCWRTFPSSSYRIAWPDFSTTSRFFPLLRLSMSLSSCFLHFLFVRTQRSSIAIWDELKLKIFKEKSGASYQSALDELVQTAKLLHLQLGTAYQDDRHLRDIIMKAIKGEPFRHSFPPPLRKQQGLCRRQSSEVFKCWQVKPLLP